MKSTTILTLSILFTVSAYAQFPNALKYDLNIKDYIIYEENKSDTIFGTINTLWQGNFGIRKMIFTKDNGENIELKGAKACMVIHEFRMAGQRWRFVPADPDKPEKKKAHLCIIAEGPITFYVHEYVQIKTENGKRDIEGHVMDGLGIYNIEYDGKYRSVYTKTKFVNKEIIPFMERCAAYKSTRRGEKVDYNALWKEVRIYNKMCE